MKEWAAMVRECRSSGLTVKNWCMNNGVNIKTYYYRLTSNILQTIISQRPAAVCLSNKKYFSNYLVSIQFSPNSNHFQNKRKGSKPKVSSHFLMVPVTGVEPVRILLHWILSPARLPIPPHRQLSDIRYDTIKDGKCQANLNIKIYRSDYCLVAG